jgi:hypothetical protein
MLTLKEIKAHVWELTLEGVVTKSDIQTMERELMPALQGDASLGLIIRAEGLKDLTADALAEDEKFEFGMMTQWAKIARMAIVTDLQALTALLKWVDPIAPMIDMRAFTSSEIAAAESFVCDLSAQPDAVEGSGMTLLSDGKDGLIAYEVDGRISAEDVDRLLAPLEALMKGDDPINLLVRFRSFDGFDPAILANGSLLGIKMNAITHLRRYAVIGAPKWMVTTVSTIAAMMPFEMKMFDNAQDEAAWAWVRAD